MKLHEIKTAVDSGQVVHQHHSGYQVIKDKLGQYLITYKHSEWAISLTWTDGETMNGQEEEFYLG